MTSDSRLARKIRETKALAADAGLDPHCAPMLVTFELPAWGGLPATRELALLARLPGTAVAAVSTDPLPEVRRMLATAPNLQIIAERGLVCGLSGGATLHAYPTSEAELHSFSAALFAAAAPEHVSVALAPFLSSGRQEVTFEAPAPARRPTAREILHAIRDRGGTAAYADEGESAVVVEDHPSELEAVRAALAYDLAHLSVRVSRLPSGRFRIAPSDGPRAVASERLKAAAQGIAMTCDRFLGVRGEGAFSFMTEAVARWRHGPETGALRLAKELFDAPDMVVPHLGLHPFSREGTLFFAYEGSETVWEAANKGIACVTVRDIVEYGRILHAIRKGEE